MSQITLPWPSVINDRVLKNFFKCLILRMGATYPVLSLWGKQPSLLITTMHSNWARWIITDSGDYFYLILYTFVRLLWDYYIKYSITTSWSLKKRAIAAINHNIQSPMLIRSTIKIHTAHIQQLTYHKNTQIPYE